MQRTMSDCQGGIALCFYFMSDCQGGIALCFYFMSECDVQIIKPSNNKTHVIT